MMGLPRSVADALDATTYSQGRLALSQAIKHDSVAVVMANRQSHGVLAGPASRIDKTKVRYSGQGGPLVHATLDASLDRLRDNVGL
jgi:hypothetical protein